MGERLSEILEKKQRGVRQSGWKVDKILAELDSNDAATLNEALKKRDGSGEYVYKAPTIQAALEEMGVEVSDKTIRAWRNRKHQ